LVIVSIQNITEYYLSFTKRTRKACNTGYSDGIAGLLYATTR